MYLQKVNDKKENTYKIKQKKFQQRREMYINVYYAQHLNKNDK